MALVPSGRVRVMKAQELPILARFSEDRSSISQQNLGSGSVAQNNTATTPNNSNMESVVNDLQQKVDQQPVDTTQSQPMGDQSSQDANVQPQQGGESGAESGSLKDTVYKMLIGIGVLQREWDTKSERLFQQSTDLSTHTVSGFYLIPSYTRSKKVSYDDAIKIAKEIATKFGLTGKIDTVGNYYKVNFNTAKQTGMEQHGSAFDEIPAAGKKEASTLTEMLKARRNSLHQIMSKIAHNMEKK